jgi:Caudovirus prohead serine protease
VLFQHGSDPFVGNKPLGPLLELREDAKGAGYVVPMLDTTYNRDLIPGLEAGLYGASFRFRTLRGEYVEKPRASAHNPDRLPERTLRELELFEFGPVTFAAYPGASAGVRGAVRGSAIAPRRGRPSTVVTPVRRIELKNRAGRVVDVLIPGQSPHPRRRGRAHPPRPVQAGALPRRRADPRRTQAHAGQAGAHRAGRRPLGEALAQINSGRTDMYGLAPRSRHVLPLRTRTTRPVLPRSARAPSRVLP